MAGCRTDIGVGVKQLVSSSVMRDEGAMRLVDCGFSARCRMITCKKGSARMQAYQR
jgi:hypothetical protein